MVSLISENVSCCIQQASQINSLDISEMFRDVSLKKTQGELSFSSKTIDKSYTNHEVQLVSFFYKKMRFFFDSSTQSALHYYILQSHGLHKLFCTCHIFFLAQLCQRQGLLPRIIQYNTICKYFQTVQKYLIFLSRLV